MSLVLAEKTVAPCFEQGHSFARKQAEGTRNHEANARLKANIALVGKKGEFDEAIVPQVQYGLRYKAQGGEVCVCAGCSSPAGFGRL